MLNVAVTQDLTAGQLKVRVKEKVNLIDYELIVSVFNDQFQTIDKVLSEDTIILNEMVPMTSFIAFEVFDFDMDYFILA
jgi:hypothetical protein